MRGHHALAGRQARHRAASRRVRHRLHRGRLPCVEPQGRGLLPRSGGYGFEARPNRGLRFHLQEGRRRCRGSRVGRPHRVRGAGGHYRREDVGRPGGARAANDARREPAHDRRVGGPLEGGWPACGVRCRALLRRLQSEPRLCPGLRGGGRGGGCRFGGSLRDQRRRAALRSGADRRSHSRCLPEPGFRHPLPQRLRLRGGQHARGRARRRHAGAGYRERHRRARGQHRPAHGHRRLGAEDGCGMRGAPQPRPAYRRGPVRGRALQRVHARASSLHGLFGLRPQGRLARQRHRAVPRRLRAREPRRRGQHEPHSGE